MGVPIDISGNSTLGECRQSQSLFHRKILLGQYLSLAEVLSSFLGDASKILYNTQYTLLQVDLQEGRK